MDNTRRRLLQTIFPAMLAAGASAIPAFSAPQGRRGGQGPILDQQQQQPGQLPENAPPDVVPKVDNDKILKHNQDQIQSDVERLFALAGELKDQVEKTNSAQVLSLPLLAKAEEVEKLAHQIKSLAKG